MSDKPKPCGNCPALQWVTQGSEGKIYSCIIPGFKARKHEELYYPVALDCPRPKQAAVWHMFGVNF